ncbi:hypothetical protein [Mycolicibacterium fortuitum]|uniref:hypothetical protein n=1 Tax=Mycolicibacterium fortuitum TaxID=1766 RepID=UPI000A8BFF9A|nr:hypothetical protein [Mycolicibacterium fortuitum]
MIAEVRLVSNDGASTARFWSAIFNVPAEHLGADRWGLHSWRITPATGPAVVVSTARVVETISRYVEVTVAVDAGAADRLRELGFEVAHDGSQAVDVNGCDSTVFLVVRDFMQTISSVDPSAIARFLCVWFEAKQQRPEFGVRWVSVRRTTFEVRPAIAPDRQWVPLGARDYAAAVARVVAAGFDVVPSVTHPETAAHCDVGNVTFILTELAHR